MAATGFLRQYRSEGTPGAYSGRTNVKRAFPFLTDRQIQRRLNYVDSYTLYREAKRPRLYNPTYLYKRRILLQLDLIDITRLKEDNGDTTFLLAAIDCFSRYAVCLPLRNKSGAHVAQTLVHILDQMFSPPTFERVTFDRGTEFLNQHVRNVLAQRNIDASHPSNKPFHIERFNRTIQRLIYQSCAERGTLRYLEHLQRIMLTYNSRYHSTIRMSPLEADLPINRQRVLNAVTRVNQLVENKVKKPSLQMDDHVRILVAPNTFSKSYDHTWSYEIF